MAGGDPEGVRGEHVMKAARSGNPDALVVLDELCWWIALGLANLTAVLDPQRFVLGGGLADEGDLIIEPTQRAFLGLVEGGASRPEIPIMVARLGARAGAIGAALATTRGGLQ
jgi:glucokinase